MTNLCDVKSQRDYVDSSDLTLMVLVNLPPGDSSVTRSSINAKALLVARPVAQVSSSEEKLKGASQESSDSMRNT